MKTTNIALAKGMEVVSIEALKGVNPVFAGATFLAGDQIEIPDEPQIAKETRSNGKIRVYIGVIINGSVEKMVNLASFTSCPMTGTDEKCKEQFLRRHEVNAAICQGDAADQITYLAGKKLKVSKEIAWAPILVQDAQTGKWSWKRLEDGEYDHRDQKFSVFELAK